MSNLCRAAATLAALLLLGGLAASPAVAAPRNAPAVKAAATTTCPPPAAHRGQSMNYPENTRPAIQAALDAGVRWIENDVRFNRSNVPFIIHDADVYRTSNSAVHRDIHDMWWYEIDALDWGYPKRFGTKFKGTKVMTLWDWLDMVRRGGAQGLVELKDEATAENMAAFWARVDQTAMADRIVVMSFSKNNINKVRAQRPDVRTMLLESPLQAASIRRAGPVPGSTAADTESVRHFGGYSPDERYVGEPELRYWTSTGLPVVPWTTDAPTRWAQLAAMGLPFTAVTTNNSVGYLQWMRDNCQAAQTPSR